LGERLRDPEADHDDIVNVVDDHDIDHDDYNGSGEHDHHVEHVDDHNIEHVDNVHFQFNHDDRRHDKYLSRDTGSRTKAADGRVVDPGV
jgi:hypothetical protein